MMRSIRSTDTREAHPCDEIAIRVEGSGDQVRFRDRAQVQNMANKEAATSQITSWTSTPQACHVVPASRYCRGLELRPRPAKIYLVTVVFPRWLSSNEAISARFDNAKLLGQFPLW